MQSLFNAVTHHVPPAVAACVMPVAWSGAGSPPLKGAGAGPQGWHPCGTSSPETAQAADPEEVPHEPPDAEPELQHRGQGQ